MRRIEIILATFLLLSTLEITAGDTMEMNDAQFQAAFVCPESLQTQKQREAEIKSFLEWVAKHHPDWTIARAIEYRVELLEKHGCHETLRNISKRPK